MMGGRLVGSHSTRDACPHLGYNTSMSSFRLAGLAFVSLLVAVPARAELGSDRVELYDLSAWTLRAGELAVGPREVALGVADVLEIKTVYALNAVGSPNAALKWLIHDDAPVGLGVEVGFFHFDPGLVGLDDTFTMTAVPLRFLASGRPNQDLRLHGAIEFLAARPNEEASDLVKRLERHLGPVGRLTARLGAEYRFGTHVAAVLMTETPLIQHRAELRYAGESGLGDFFRATLSFHFMVESFNLRVGGGYGPSWLGQTGFFPTAELYFRIY